MKDDRVPQYVQDALNDIARYCGTDAGELEVRPPGAPTTNPSAASPPSSVGLYSISRGDPLLPASQICAAATITAVAVVLAVAVPVGVFLGLMYALSY